MKQRLHLAVKPKRRGPSVRLLLMLADGAAHELSEFYNFVADAVSPPAASRTYISCGGRSAGERQRRIARRTERTLSDPEAVVAEGRRLEIIRCLWHMKRKGQVEFDLPEREARDVVKSPGYVDPHKIIVRLTAEGKRHLLRGNGVWCKVVSELCLGLDQGLLSLRVAWLGRKLPPEVDGESR